MGLGGVVDTGDLHSITRSEPRMRRQQLQNEHRTKDEDQRKLIVSATELIL